jgi:hypothetical protein
MHQHLCVSPLEIGERQYDSVAVGRRPVSKSLGRDGFDTIPQTKKLCVSLVPCRFGNALNSIEYDWAHGKFDNGIVVTHRELKAAIEALTKITMSHQMHEVALRREMQVTINERNVRVAMR